MRYFACRAAQVTGCRRYRAGSTEGDTIMKAELRQRGRALMDFEVSIRRHSSRLQAEAEEELAAMGIDADALPDDMEARHEVIDRALAGSSVFQLRALLGDWCARQHGLAAQEAFAEIEDALSDKLDALIDGRSRVVSHDFASPAYWADNWFHRTRGGWDASPRNGFVHAEIVHRQYVAKVFPGDIYGNRRAVLNALPRSDYRCILEIGTSSGHHTEAIAKCFPDAAITGIDPSLRMIEQACRVGNEKGLEWDLHVGVGEHMPMFADGIFDLVTAYAVHHEMPTDAIAAMFEEMFRVTAPGGDMIIADVARTQSRDRLSGWRMDWAARWGGEPFWRSSASLDMAPLAEAAGFHSVRAWEPDPGRDPYIVYGRRPA
jgi:SAM-dependent methyltransferase